MANLLLDSLPLDVVVGVRIQHENLVTLRRRFSNKMSSTTRSANTRARVWTNLRTLRLSAADADALRAVLDAPGTVTASGEIVGSPSIEVKTQNARSIAGPLEDQVIVEFEMVEVL